MTTSRCKFKKNGICQNLGSFYALTDCPMIERPENCAQFKPDYFPMNTDIYNADIHDIVMRKCFYAIIKGVKDVKGLKFSNIFSQIEKDKIIFPVVFELSDVDYIKLCKQEKDRQKKKLKTK